MSTPQPGKIIIPRLSNIRVRFEDHRIYRPQFPYKLGVFHAMAIWPRTPTNILIVVDYNDYIHIAEGRTFETDGKCDLTRIKFPVIKIDFDSEGIIIVMPNYEKEYNDKRVDLMYETRVYDALKPGTSIKIHESIEYGFRCWSIAVEFDGCNVPFWLSFSPCDGVWYVPKEKLKVTFDGNSFIVTDLKNEELKKFNLIDGSISGG
jgi:hypothetical protein